MQRCRIPVAESVLFNSCRLDGVGVIVLEARATSKSVFANAADGAGNMYFGEAAAISVFVYICVSKPSRQNGRKVTRKYIRIAEKIKI